MTFDDDIYDDDSGPSRDDFGNDFALNLYNEGPALRSGYVPLPPLENGDGTGSAGIDEGDPETFLTLRDPSRSTIDWNRFVSPATPEEIKAYDEWEERRAKEGMGAVISQVFADRRQAWEQTPKEAAYRMWLERQTGISQRMLKDPDVLRTAEMRAQMGMDALTLHDAPEQVVSWLKTPWMLEIARDDLETLKKKAEKPAWRTAEVDGITKELEQEALSAGLDKAEARQWSKMAGAFVGVTSKRYNVAPSELAKMKLRQGTEETQGESFGQPPLNNDVDLGAKVNVVKAQRTMPDVPSYERGKAFTPEMRAEIAERFRNGQVVNAHTGLTVTLSKSGGLDHVIHTARGLRGEAGKALYQAIPYLDQLAREAYRVESHDDRKPSPTKVEGQVGNLKQVHRFLVPVDLVNDQNHIRGDRHVLLLTAKEYETGKAELDSVSLYDMKHAKKMSGHSSRDSLDSTGQASRNISNPDNISVRELVDAVNDAEGKPYVGEKYQQSAYNGSPVLYDKFDMSKVGSGNGTASYGWGAYLSSAREVAELYVRLAGGYGENAQVAKFDIPENDVLLSYDKRFSEQPQKVKDALQPYADEYKQSNGERGIKIYDVFSGAQIQEKIADALNEGRISVEGGLNGPVEANSREVSMFLNSLGIPGLRYPDDGGKGDNFVIWDENVMHMLEREVNGRTEMFTPVSQTSARQSEEYDYSDPKTWPAGPARDEALALQAWQNFEPDGEIETWPESPEKTEALALREEYGEIEAWIESMLREEFERRLRSDDPEFVRKNERGEEIENRLSVLARRLRKKKPKGAERRLLQLIEAEEEAAAREAETYYQTAYHGGPHQNIDKEYFAALEAGDMETAQRIVDEQARQKGYERDSGYRMTHRAPDGRDEFNANLATVRESDLVPDDYWTKPQYYQYSDEEYESFYTVKKALNSPTGVIRMYRAVPKGVKESGFRNGDWITPSRAYAKQEGMSIPGGYRIITQEVKTKDVWWDGNSICEFGFDDGKGYAYKNTKNNRKLTEVIVRDHDGAIIPPSRRFNARRSEEYYQIIGRRGAEALDAAEEGTARLDNLNIAREMEQSGRNAKTIRLATGWERGADGKWRYEIPDGTFRREGLITNPDLLEFRELERKFIDGDITEGEQARLKELTPVVRGARKPSRLSDFYDAPELYAAYPELADISVKFQDRYGEGKGSYSPSENTISLDMDLRGDAAKTVLVHEIQHAIQRIEGFARGGSPSGMWLGQARKHTLKIYKELRAPLSLEEYAKNAWQTDEVTDEIHKGYKEYLKTATSREADRAAQEGAGRKAYHHLGGEVEARNAEKRTRLSNEERKERLLTETEDVAQEDQIILEEMMDSEMAYSVRRGPLTFKLTGEPVSREYMAALEKLEAGEPVAADEYNAIPEIQDARSRTATGSTLGMPGREAIRKQVYDKLMSYGSAVTEVVDGWEQTVYNGEVRNDRRADIIIGLPASGKSSALVDPISSKYKSMLIDSDEAKKLIPEFDDGFGAGFVHEESKRIVGRVYEGATDEGRNVVIPIVGSDYTKLEKDYIDPLRQKGYQVYVHMADINPNVAAGRNLRRFAETGRFVDLEATSFKYGNKPREVFERVKKEGVADGYSRIDTTVFPGRQVEGTEDISHDRGDLREGRGGIPSGTLGVQGRESSQTGTAGGGRRAAEGLNAERAGGTSREGMAPRGVSGQAPDINGRLTVQPDGVSLIEFFKNANRSTSFHELAHHMFRVIYELSGRDGVDPQLIQDVDTILREAGVTREEFESDNAEVRKAARTRVHEFFARSFEVYISEGRAPSKELRGVFRRLRAWMIEVYHDVVQALGVELSDEMRGVYDRLLAMPEEIDAETTIRELAVEEAALKEEIQRHEAEMREREAQERISAEGGEEWASLEIPEDAMEAVDSWLSELESYEIGRAARAEVRKTLDYIREEGGLNFDRLVHLMGDEAAGELRKKLGNFYFTSKKALSEGRGLPLDVLAEALGMDENGLVAFLEGIEGGKLKKPAPLLEVNTDTLNALIDRLGVEGAHAYLKDRARYLTKQQKAIQQEYDKDKGNTQVKADLEATYREQREIADGLRALEGTLKAEGDITPEQVIEPVPLTTESGRSIDEADDSELLLTPDGSTELGRIDEDVAEAAGIAAGEIRANVGAVRHAEETHGAQILDAGYPDAQTFILNSLAEFNEIRKGSGDSLLLIRHGDGKEHPTVAVELINEDGVYRVKTAWIAREKYVEKKELLATRSASPAIGPDSDPASLPGVQSSQGEPRRWSARRTSNSVENTVSPGKSDVNPMLSLSEAMRRGYEMAEKYAKAAFRAGREEAAAKARERTQLLKKKLQERQALKKEVNKLVKGINNMAKSESITWARHKELEELLADYDLKKRSKKTLDRRAELEEYLKENPEAADTMNAADLKYLGTKTLNDMTLDDLRTLSEQVQQIYDRGHEEYKVWDLERTERRDTIHSELVAVLKKRKTNLPKIVTKSEDLKKQYKGITGKLAKAKDWTYAATLGPDRFFDWLDKGATDYTGAFVRHLVDGVNKQRDVALRHIFERRKWMEDRLRPLGFRMSDFTRIAATVEGQDFTWDDIMEIYIGMRNDKKGRAILYGNLKNTSDPEGTAAYLIGLLSEDHKKAAELVVEDHNRNVNRIEAGLIDAFQKGMDRETDYTSIHRLEHLSSMGLIDAESAEALTDGMADAGVLRRVEDGFMKKRVEIKDENQTPVKLGLFSNWHEDVSRHEHTAAMAGTARDIAGALLMRNPVDGQTIGRMVKERFGDEAWRTLVDFVNTNVTDDARLAHNLLDKMSNTMMKNMVIAYLAGNLGTALKQTTSIPRFLITAGPHRILVSIAQFLTQGPKFLENVYELDPQMRDRMGSPILTMLR